MHLILQLHITGKCNLRCKHCYIEDHSVEMPINQIEKVLKQFKNLILIQQLFTRKKVYGHVHVTGGEPLMHSEITKVLDLFAEYSRLYYFGIMSNGTLLTESIVTKLKKIRLKAFQVSLDGNRETHDKLRSNGNFDKTVGAIDFLHSHGIPCRVSFTANNNNFLQFSDVAQICREHNADSLWSDRYIPFYENNSIKTVSIDNMERYISNLNLEHKNNNHPLDVQNMRALQFLESNFTPYKCLAGERLITVDEYGNIVPCRRMPIVCGNIENTVLTKVYYFNKVFRDLRKHKTTGKCKKCKYKKTCAGGLRCLSYALNKDYNTPDPGCYYVE